MCVCVCVCVCVYTSLLGRVTRENYLSPPGNAIAATGPHPHLLLRSCHGAHYRGDGVCYTVNGEEDEEVWE